MTSSRFKSLLAPLGRSAVTLVIVLLAVLVGIWLWKHYETDPWTRDGKIRADVVRVTPDVAGLVTQVAVHDNQAVKPGDVLFVVDRPRFQLTLAQSIAAFSSLVPAPCRLRSRLDGWCTARKPIA